MKNGISQLCNAFLMAMSLVTRTTCSGGINYRGCVAEMGATDQVFAHPLHPYTQMLMASVPRLDKKWEEGEVDLTSNHSERTTGCVYYERCPVAFSRCLEEPPLIDIEKDHPVACWKESDKNAKARQNTSL